MRRKVGHIRISVQIACARQRYCVQLVKDLRVMRVPKRTVGERESSSHLSSSQHTHSITAGLGSHAVKLVCTIPYDMLVSDGKHYKLVLIRRNSTYTGTECSL